MTVTVDQLSNPWTEAQQNQHSRGRVMTVLVILLPTLTLSLRVPRVFVENALSVVCASPPAVELAASLRVRGRPLPSPPSPAGCIGGLLYEAGVGLPSSSPAIVLQVRAKKKAGSRMLWAVESSMQTDPGMRCAVDTSESCVYIATEGDCPVLVLSSFRLTVLQYRTALSNKALPSLWRLDD